jgi:hypothetical protein
MTINARQILFQKRDVYCGSIFYELSLSTIRYIEPKRTASVISEVPSKEF